MKQISRDSIEQASVWMARLWADDVAEHDKQAFQTWRTANPDNEFAWQQLEQIQSKFNAIPQPALSRKVLSKSRNMPSNSAPLRGISRRQVLLIGGVSLGTLGLVLNSRAERPHGAEYVTAVGEVREITLSDGTQMAMNTATRVFVDFNQYERRLHLLEGEILITSSHHLTPFFVTTKQGKVTPIGTRFSVQQRAEDTLVAVYEGEVALQPERKQMAQHLLAGENATFTRIDLLAKDKNPSADPLWLEQKIMAQNTPLPQFMEELSRYRKGVLNVDKNLSELKLTGVFSTLDTDETLFNISQILPVEIQYRTPLWVRVSAKK
ncbi:FecR family protein [Vibrio tapetis subsp. quintayensis]|uniref:FecR domain-containing protein n=1 Tax=Vibrio tapetis TaxID=52443 RepID=UPI0025B49121|nr:FecR family protein [Vibrio tapetis]MDN3681211.1 FecR family protein [Vibrio tapetis subsp. quintayensis]